jgi:hypothetical protein
MQRGLCTRECRSYSIQILFEVPRDWCKRLVGEENSSFADTKFLVFSVLIYYAQEGFDPDRRV